MLIIALVLAAIGLAALVFAVVTSNALVAWVCIGASVLGVLLLVVDALRERRRGAGPAATADDDDDDSDEPAADGSDEGSGDDDSGSAGVADDTPEAVEEAAETVQAADLGEAEVAVDEAASQPAD